MVENETNKDTPSKETNKEAEVGKVEVGVKPLSPVDEARDILTQITKQKEELKTENERKEKRDSDVLLSSTGGGAIEPVEKKETDQEYVARMQANGWRADG